MSKVRISRAGAFSILTPRTGQEKKTRASFQKAGVVYVRAYARRPPTHTKSGRKK